MFRWIVNSILPDQGYLNQHFRFIILLTILFHVSASSTLFSKDIQIHICVDIVFFILYYEHTHFSGVTGIEKRVYTGRFCIWSKIHISKLYTECITRFMDKLIYSKIIDLYLKIVYYGFTVLVSIEYLKITISNVYVKTIFSF